MAMEMTQILLNAQSADGNVRKIAEENLGQFQEQNLAGFLLSLSVELANNDKPPETRRLAGLILKNSLDAKEAARKEGFLKRWVALDQSVKYQIKNELLQTLSSTVSDARHTSSQVIAKIAAIEIPRQEWPELVGILLANMVNPQVEKPMTLNQATLETLGYVCEEISSDMLAQDQVNSILTAVVQGMNVPAGNSDVCLAATKALYNALDFAQTNFENEMERNYIMSVISETTLSADVRIRQASFECLVSISSTYYEKLAPYIQDIFTITAKAVRTDEEPVALQAIEFWSSICDDEIEIQEEYGVDFSGDSEVPHYHFIKKALPVLVPLLLETLTKQDEDQDQDEGAWNLAMAGGTCLRLVARTIEDDIVPLVMPYVQENISKPDWRCREAATYAFGSIIEGPSLEKLSPLVKMALNFILNALKDKNNQVKDTTAWTLGRIFEFLHGPTVQSPVITPANLQSIVAALLESIKDAPNVADKVCYAIYFLALGYEQISAVSCPLSPFLPDIIGSLLSMAERKDAADSRIRTAAYETLNEVVRCSTLDTANVIMQLLPFIMTKLGQTMELQIVSSDEREKQGDLQALLCGVLQVIIQKLGNQDATKFALLKYADQMMALFLQVFACRSSTVHEEAMLAIGALAYATGPEFAKYMPDFYKYVEMGLQNFEEYQACAVTVGVVGDICRALEAKIFPFCDGIITHLLKALSSSQLHRSVKPPIFSCFGDIALAIDGNFEKYLAYAMAMLQSAAEIAAQTSSTDDEMVELEYNNQFRNGIFEAYSGILQGFKNAKPELMMPYAVHILQFIEAVFRDKERDDSVTKAAAGVLGDLADTLGNNAAPVFRNSTFYNEFLSECMASEDNQVKETTSWAHATIQLVIKS